MKTNKCILKYISASLMLCTCCFFLLNPVLAMPDTSGIVNNSSSVLNSKRQAAISEYSHLIELSFDENNYIIVGEAIVYSTDENSSDEFILWVPENADVMQFQATGMTASTTSTPINYSREGNLLLFRSPLSDNSSKMPLLYGIKYSVHSHEEVATFRKILREENVFGYPVSRLILIVNHRENEVPPIVSAQGSPLIADEITSKTNQTSYVWSTPQFTELEVTLEEDDFNQTAKTSYNSLIIPGILAIIIIAATMLYYRRKSSGDLTELEDIYEAEMIVIAQIKEDRKKNKLSGEDAERLLKKHNINAAKIKSKVEKLKKT